MKCEHVNKIYKVVGPHIGEYCEQCNRWLRWVPKSEVAHMTILNSNKFKDTIKTKLITLEDEIEEQANSTDMKLPWEE